MSRLLFWSSLALLNVDLLPGQQTIFDVPSGDVAAHGQWFYQHQTVLRAWGSERHWLQSNAYGYGVGHDFEIDTSWFNVERHAVQQSAPSVGFKWSPRINSAESTLPMRFVFGDMIQFRESLPHMGNWAYAMLQAEVPSTRTHVTGGVSSGTRVLFGEKTTGVIIGVEQRLSQKWMLQADWFSGNHDLAYCIPGVVYRVTSHWMVSLGYQIPNRRTHGYGAAVFELTRTP